MLIRLLNHPPCTICKTFPHSCSVTAKCGHIKPTLEVGVLDRIPRARNSGQITPHAQILHPKEMLSDQTNLSIVLHRIRRVAVLQREPVAMVDVDIAIRHIVRKQTPEEISCNDGVTQVLSSLYNVVKGLQRRGLWVVGRPVVLADEVDFVHALDKCDVLF